MESQSKNKIIAEGVIKEIISGDKFKVELTKINGVDLQQKQIVLAHVSGKMRMHHIRILLGDTVDVELSEYDLTRGRILYRKK